MEKFIAQAEKWRTLNTLLHVRYSKQKVGPLSFSGRILSVEKEEILFYDVDSKTVLKLSLGDLDDLVPSAASE
ncbi:hypothetical protein QTG56_00450 [Rossellomorea sp. AcN35-11]|nr:hypothetical protein [Rossellomorea aquimaris]WJV29682.1 hypothetical protein QTG56_00450 [Rossellomorea sp. AcN35-11]